MLIAIGYPRLSEHGMFHYPWRPGRRWSIKPSGMAPNKSGAGGDSGDRPLGKKSKKNRIKTGPPGTPQGICIVMRDPNCRCGKFQFGTHTKNSLGK